jgi:PhoPQ-activated pathogenicity-related protein
MRVSYFVISLIGFAVAAVLSPLTNPSSADLYEYNRKPEPAFAWQLKGSGSAAEERLWDIELASQSWQSVTWRHRLQIYQPRGTAPDATMFLWVTGGSPGTGYQSMGMELARKIGAPVAFLYDVPNQPLLEGSLYEDDLIAESFVRYLKSGDENWPLLFPMVKSVVKAMDALQEFGKKQWHRAPEKFVVAGASKRGWTTWLTAAVDPRVGAIAPAVIDTLNMSAQMTRQVETLGAYSSRLSPYSSRGLLPIPQTPRGARLLGMVDPWAYRDRLTMPKLIVNATNDFYWATGALNLYWDGIPGDKWVHYIPNAGHDLRRQDRPAGEQLNDLMNGLAAFTRHRMAGTSLPSFSWKHESSGGELRLTVTTSVAPKRARLWMAHAPTSDFRAAHWQDRPLVFSTGTAVAQVVAPAAGELAIFAELGYEIAGLPYQISTQMRTTGEAAGRARR